MTDQARVIVDPSGKPARASLEDLRCPRCGTPSPPGDETRRERSGGFGPDVHDVCRTCGCDFEGLTV